MSAVPDPAIIDSVQWRSQGIPDFTGAGFNDFFWMLGAKPNELAPWWSPKRDLELRRYSRTGLPSSILYGRITEIKNLGWTLVTDDKEQEANLDKYYQMFEESQLEEGFRTFLELYVKDRHTQDNGGFVELIAPGDPQQLTFNMYQEQSDGRKVPVPTEVWAKPPTTKDQIIGFAAMDASTCWRTYNREYPVVYRSPFDGRLYVFHRSRVVARAQFRDTLERSRGLGLCSMSRAYDALELARVNNRYVFEMMSGTQPRLAIARGIQSKAIEAALQDGEIQASNKGVYYYRGTAFVQGDSTIENGAEPINFYDLNHVPDGWDRDTELTLALYMVAMAFGTEPRDLGWPATQTGATKADAESMDVRNQGRGRADEISDIEEWMSSRLLPKGIRLEFDTTDTNEEHRKAEISRLRADARSIQVMTGEIDRGEAREMAAREGDIPAEFLETRTIIEDDSNPTDNNVNPADSQPDDREFEDPEDESEENEARKGIAQTRRTLGDSLTKLLKRARDGKVRRQPFLEGTRAIMERDIDKAFRDGLRSGGKRDSATLNADQRRELMAYQKAQAPYYRALRDWVFSDPAPDDVAISTRVYLWRNKGLEEAYMKGKLLAKPGQLYEFVLGRARHCPSCLAAAKQVHAATDWIKAGIYPRSSDLECGGFNCDCKFRKATKAQVVGNLADIPKRTGYKAVIDFATLGDSHMHEAVT